MGVISSTNIGKYRKDDDRYNRLLQRKAVLSDSIHTWSNDELMWMCFQAKHYYQLTIDGAPYSSGFTCMIFGELYLRKLTDKYKKEYLTKS